VFGVPLAAVQSSPDGVPLFLKKAAEAVEAWAPGRGGVYRCITFKSHIDNFRVQIETDVEKVNFMDPTKDPHIASSMIMKFLEEMPDRLLSFRFAERLVYADYDLQGRISFLLRKINGLSKQKRAVLEFTLRHLNWISTLPHDGRTESMALGARLYSILTQPQKDVFELEPRRVQKVRDIVPSFKIIQDLIENVDLLFCPTKIPPSMEIGRSRRVVSCKFLPVLPPMGYHSRSLSSLPILLFSNEQVAVGESSITMDSDELSRVSSASTKKTSKELCDTAKSMKVPCDISQLHQSHTEFSMIKQSIPIC
jgi:hypothetical protein